MHLQGRQGLVRRDGLGLAADADVVEPPQVVDRVQRIEPGGIRQDAQVVKRQRAAMFKRYKDSKGLFIYCYPSLSLNYNTG